MSKAQTKVITGSEARALVLKGAEITAGAVGSTLGPMGGIVLIRKDEGMPISTKDGHTVAQSINLRDPVMRMGSELIKDAAAQTNELGGDGTTTTSVLSLAMMEEAARYLTSYPSVKLIEGVQLAARQVAERLGEAAFQLTEHETLEQIATISANNDPLIGKIISAAFERVGRSGIITVEDAKGTTTSLEVVEGMQFERGYLSPYFVNVAEKMVAAYGDALILVTDKKIVSAKDVIPALELAARAHKPLLIVAEDVEGEALQTLVLNRTKGGAQVAAVKAPGYGDHKVELLQDIAILTGATLISPTNGRSLEKLSLGELGTVKKFVVDRGFTTLVGTGRTSEAVEARIAEITGQLADVTLSTESSSRLRVRAARLAGGVAVIKVGGATETEMTERKYRIEDALHATHAAIDEGVLPGGGVALVRAAEGVRCEGIVDPGVEAGMGIVLRACAAPLRRIVSNANGSPDVVLNDVKMGKDPLKGYNALTGEFVDMLVAGVIDPAKVTRLAVKHAASVCCTFLNLDAVVVEDVD